VANICTNYITISGPARTIKRVRTLIQAQDKGLLAVFDHAEITDMEKDVAYGLESSLDDIGQGDEPIRLCITSKWSPPEKDFETFTTAYPDLTLTCQYEEPGNNRFGDLEYQGGGKTLDQAESPEEYYEKNDECFGEFLKEIKTLPYDQFFKQYILDTKYIDSETWEQHGYLLEKYVLARVRKRDLPLLVNYPWTGWGGNKEEFLNRLQGKEPTFTLPEEVTG